MKIPRFWFFPLLFCCPVSPAAAQDSAIYQHIFAEKAPELRHLQFVWAIATGDLNGDGIPDVAMLLTGRASDEQSTAERLVVLAGLPGDNYKILAVSGEFCHPGKFYNLDIRKMSLFVEAVEYADSSRKGSYTLQFRYNPKVNDLELIGKESGDESYEDGSVERTSSNFLTGKSIHTVRERGKTTAKEKAIQPSHVGLKGTACDAFPG